MSNTWKLRPQHVGLVVVFITLVLLILGVSLPCIEVRSKVFGFINLTTEKRSVLSLIIDLFSTKILLAILLTLFSIIIPVSKLCFTVYLLIIGKRNNNAFLDFLVHNIGKWSMADVFSMALVVTMLTFDNLKIKIFSTEGRLLAGYYFFLAYGLLSILSTLFIQRKISK